MQELAGIGLSPNKHEAASLIRERTPHGKYRWPSLPPIPAETAVPDWHQD